MKKIISINGMTCQKCAKRVETSLKSLDEKAKVKINLKKDQALFSSKLNISDQQIEKVISDIGYNVTSIN